MKQALKRKHVCPRCGHEGYGPYSRWVLNAKKQKYEPYFYFAHKHGKQISWCYIPRSMLDNSSSQRGLIRSRNARPRDLNPRLGFEPSIVEKFTTEVTVLTWARKALSLWKSYLTTGKI